MNSRHNLLLADEDMDDSAFFKDALGGLPVDAPVTLGNDGEVLMNTLHSNLFTFPDLPFLHFNMPRKNGLKCLEAMKSDIHLVRLPVIIYSTSFNPEAVDFHYHKGAHFYFRTPRSYSGLKKVIRDSLAITLQDNIQPSRENFELKDK